jgi:iron uptake system component EfeO
VPCIRLSLHTSPTLFAAGALVTVLAACSSSGGGAGGGTNTGGGTPHTDSAGPDSRIAHVTVTAAQGCTTDRAEFAAGGITFKIVNKDATGVSEVELLDGRRIVGEKENIPPGIPGEFAVKVGAGTYTLYCPGAKTEKTKITVTGTAEQGDASVAALLKAATTNYAKYVSTQVGYLLDAVTKLDAALHGTELSAAQDAYKKARPFYEKIEPVAESFTVGKQSLDADIDARANDVPATKWTGFHRIEKGLFADKGLAGLGKYGDGLVANVTKLRTLTEGLTYKATELANGAQGLLDEVAASKITGEEERYSHIDLLDFANNDEGAEQAFAQLEPALKKIDPALAGTIAAKFKALDALVDTYRSSKDSSGFVLYTELTDADKAKLAAAVKAVQEPLSKVASKVANA